MLGHCLSFLCQLKQPPESGLFCWDLCGEEQDLLLREGWTQGKESPPHLFSIRAPAYPSQLLVPRVCSQLTWGWFPSRSGQKSLVTHMSDNSSKGLQIFSEDSGVFIVSSLRQMFNPRWHQRKFRLQTMPSIRPNFTSIRPK